MKKILLKLSILCTLAFLVISCDKDEVVAASSLPVSANTFLSDNFNGVQILSVVREKNTLTGTEYEVLLNNGVEVKFDKNGNWDEVEARDDNAGIPTSFISPKIVSYVTTNYAPALIHSIDKEKSIYEVELTNGLDLIFDLNGDFIRIDP